MLVISCRTKYDPETGRFGGYGEKWDNKTYPVPYTAEEDNISTLHSGRTAECARFKKCIACGDPVQGEDVWVLLKDEKVISESGPFHEKCSIITMKMCPHIVESNGSYTFKQVSWTSVKSEVIGFNS